MDALSKLTNQNYTPQDQHQDSPNCFQSIWQELGFDVTWHEEHHKTVYYYVDKNCL